MLNKKLITILIVCLFPLLLIAQEPPHPNGGEAPGEGNDPVGGGAPLGSGLVLMLTMGMAYAGRKIYFLNNRK